MFLAVLISCLLMNSALQADNSYWWPEQKAPRGIISVDPGGDRAAEMLVQSIAGLAAQAVNDGRSDELVWVETSNADYRDWKARAIRRLELEDRGAVASWELLEKYKQMDIIKGYILYKADTSIGEGNARKGMDHSVNIATSLAGILGGVIIEEKLEPEAKAHGLKLLLDARGKSQQWCFEQYRDQLNRNILCTQDPHKPNARDMAIAHRVLTIYGNEPVVEEAMQWLHPLSPVMGWIGGDEGSATAMSSVHGHFQTATDWCMNLPVLMAGARNAPPAEFPSFDPRTIAWQDKRSAVSYVLSDGDNVQWMMGGFARGQEKSWWADPSRGEITFGWSWCGAHLEQLGPDVLAYLGETQTSKDEFVEWGGGYYFPDMFARERPNRDELLAEHARRTWALMQQTNTRVIGFNFMDLDSAEARRACEIIAREMDGLVGILAFEYSAYEAGEGSVFWVTNARGDEIPVVSARYAIWNNLNRPRAGSPAKVANQIINSAIAAQENNSPSYDWVIVHCWSYFRQAQGTDDRAEEIAQNDATSIGGKRGYSPARWSAERLPKYVKTIGPEELIWRIRMQHRPQKTTDIIKRDYSSGQSAPR